MIFNEWYTLTVCNEALIICKCLLWQKYNKEMINSLVGAEIRCKANERRLDLTPIAFSIDMQNFIYACAEAVISAIISLTDSVVNDFGRSNGKPKARDQQDAAKTPKALETPNRTV